MQFLAIAALLASAVSAASTTAAAAAATGTSSCAAQNILDACLETENNLLGTCGTNDWDCKCNAYKNIVTCYNNCPNDQSVNTAQGQVQIFCGYASQYPSSTLAAAAKTGTTTTGTATKATGTAAGNSAAASGTTGTTGTTGTATGTAHPSTVTNSGADLALNAGSMLFAVAGMVAALL
ncbi:hypothetical protein SBRCBS47491_001776 [Sporothrix bragantina]|uniref:GPI anchored serine-threonine rich protein n=1 Tax=Sporothrix bragantina TaxID=671064 RepID=A0ABP0B1D5_9PEZI